MGFAHVGNTVFYAGGHNGASFEKFLRQFWMKGREKEHEPMLTARNYFPLVYYRAEEQLIAIGGNSANGYFQSVELYKIKMNVWVEFVPFPETTAFASAVIVEPHLLYKFGG